MVVVKKPKAKKPRVKIPKDSLIVDYGLNRVILPYKYPLDLYNNAELTLIDEWCKETFPIDSWWIKGFGWPGYIHFLKESYVTMFLLRWGK